VSVELAQLEEVCLLYPGAEAHEEGSYTFVLLPALVVPDGTKMKALLCPQNHSGYPTRLFLEKPTGSKSFAEHVILTLKWYTWSWKDVHASLRLAQMIAEHLRGLR
jgi:hypothetical protein